MSSEGVLDSLSWREVEDSGLERMVNVDRGFDTAVDAR